MSSLHLQVMSVNGLFDLDQTIYAHMKRFMTQDERNDWFAMYVMGGNPYPQHLRSFKNV